MQDVYIIAAARTPIGNFNGMFSGLPAVELGGQLIQQLLARHAITADSVDEVILGHVLTAGCGQNTARQASIRAGIESHTPAMTINKVCGSGLKAVHLAAQAIALGDARLVVAGGMESMSQAAHVLPNARNGRKMGNWELLDSMLSDGLLDAFHGYHMGITAENLARRFHLSREAQDAFALNSQRRAAAAIAANRFADEILAIAMPQKRGDPMLITADESPRPDTSEELLARLKPAFTPDGSVTAGNSSGINDGAAAVILCNGDTVKRLGCEPLARIRAWANAAIAPEIMGYAPVPATRNCLRKAGWKLDELDLIEANEAFAVQALTVNQELGWDPAIVNVNGGAIALGHPIGASGCRVLVTLLHEMRRRNAHKGLATLCIGGGQGVAIAVER